MADQTIADDFLAWPQWQRTPTAARRIKKKKKTASETKGLNRRFGDDGNEHTRGNAENTQSHFFTVCHDDRHRQAQLRALLRRLIHKQLVGHGPP
jgi:hypothetical protein